MKKLIVLLFVIFSGLAFANPPGTYQPLLLNQCSTVPVYLTATGTNTWTNTTGCTNFTVEVLGAGGPTGIASADLCGGAGGGAYSKSTGISIALNASVTYGIGNGGSIGGSDCTGASTGSDSWFNAANFAACASSSSCASAKSGNASTSITRGNGGAAASGIGATKFSGGDGDDAVGGARGGAGGGAAGPNGAGASGSGANGGQGDNSTGGVGGVGCAAGSAGTEWGDSIHGSGGGGGACNSAPAVQGGLYGAGAGGTRVNANGALGKAGLIKITPLF